MTIFNKVSLNAYSLYKKVAIAYFYLYKYKECLDFCEECFWIIEELKENKVREEPEFFAQEDAGGEGSYEDLYWMSAVAYKSVENYQKSIYYIFKCIQIWEPDRNEKYRVAVACFNLGEISFELGNLEKSEYFYNKCKDIYSRMKIENESWAMLYNNLAGICAEKQDIEGLKSNLDLCRQYISTSNTTAIRFYYNYGSLSNKQGRFKQALKSLKMAEKISKEKFKTDDFIYCQIMIEMGNTLYNCDDIEESDKCFDISEKMLMFTEEKKYMKERINLNLGIANNLINCCKFKEAETKLLKILDLANKNTFINSEFGMRIHKELSDLYIEMKDHESSLRHCSKALSILERLPIHFQSSRLDIYWNFLQIYYEKKSKERFMIFTKKFIKHLGNLRPINTLSELLDYHRLSVIYSHLKNYIKAKMLSDIVLEAAINILDDPMNINYVIFYLQQAKILAKMKNFDDSKLYAIKAQELFLHKKTPKLMTYVYFHLSSIFYSIKDFENSEKMIKEFYINSEKSPEIEIIYYTNLGKICTKLDRTEEALFNFENATLNYSLEGSDDALYSILNIGDQYFINNNYNQALEFYHLYIERTLKFHYENLRKFSRVYYSLWELYSVIGNVEGAFKYLEKILLLLYKNRNSDEENQLTEKVEKKIVFMIIKLLHEDLNNEEFETRANYASNFINESEVLKNFIFSRKNVYNSLSFLLHSRSELKLETRNKCFFIDQAHHKKSLTYYKVFYAEKSNKIDTLHKMLYEMYIIRVLNQNTDLVPMIYSYGVQDNKEQGCFFYFGSEKLKCSLSELQQQPESINEHLRSLTYCTIKAYRTFRDLNFIHGDVSPNNILLSSDNQFKICDFTNSYFIENSPQPTALGTYKIIPNTFVTFNYLAPELLFWTNFNEHLPVIEYNPFNSDLFSLGLILLGSQGININGLNILGKSSESYLSKILKTKNLVICGPADKKYFNLAQKKINSLIRKISDSWLQIIIKGMLRFDISQRKNISLLEQYAKLYAGIISYEDNEITS